MDVSTTIRLFLAAIDGEVAPSTATWYARRLATLERVLGPQELAGVTIDDLRRWRASLLAQGARWENHPHRPARAGKLSPHTMHANLRAVKRLFHWCLAEGHITHDPTARLRLAPLAKEQPKAVSDDDLVRLLDAAAGSGPRDLALVAFIADTACRCAGAAGARLSELDLDHRCAVVREKGQRQRTVFFGSETARALSAWLDMRPADPSDALFVNWRDGGFLSPTGVYQVFKRLARAAGLIDDGRRYNPHSLRHAWARRAIQAGMDLGTVSEIMGHTGIEVTARFYARWADRELQERKEAYSRPLPVPAHAGLAGPATGVQSGANRVTIGRQSGA